MSDHRDTEQRARKIIRMLASVAAAARSGVAHRLLLVRAAGITESSAALVMAPRHHDGVLWLSRTRPYAQLREVEQDRDQDDRKHIAACNGDAGRDQDGFQAGYDRDIL